MQSEADDADRERRVLAVDLSMFGDPLESPTVVEFDDDSTETTEREAQGVSNVVSCWRRRLRFFDEVVDGAMLINKEWLVGICWR